MSLSRTNRVGRTPHNHNNFDSCYAVTKQNFLKYSKRPMQSLENYQRQHIHHIELVLPPEQQNKTNEFLSEKFSFGRNISHLGYWKCCVCVYWRWPQKEISRKKVTKELTNAGKYPYGCKLNSFECEILLLGNSLNAHRFNSKHKFGLMGVWAC